jgi:hypothetical protein
MVIGFINENAVPMKRLLAGVAVLALVAVSCASSRDSIVAEFAGRDDTSTTVASLPNQSTTTTLLVPAEVEIAALIETVEEVRELSFQRAPAIVRRPDAVVQAEYRRVHSYAGANASPHHNDFLEMLGVLIDGESIGDLEVIAPVPGVYDSATKSILISSDVQELTPFGRLVLVGELVAALTDQQFGWADKMGRLAAAADEEGRDSLGALVNGDATFFSELYVERFMSSTERFAVQLERLKQEQAEDELPGFVKEYKAFDTLHARDLVVALISEGGIDELNRAYDNPPATSEQVYHTFRYFNGEGARLVDLPAVTVTNFEEVKAGVFGERGFRALLSAGVNSAQQLEAATGWGGDAYRLWWDGDHVVMLVFFEGDAARDAESLAETLGRWAIEELPVGGGLTDNTGLAFEGVNSYAFVAQNDTGAILVVASDPVAGKRLRDKFWPEY